MANERIRYVAEGGVATITLADVDNKNALSTGLVGELFPAFESALADESIRVIRLTNDGRVFCAGADLKETSSGGRSGADSRGLADLFAMILDSPKPVIGDIRGHAVGGGVGLAAVVDIGLAADDATFGFSEVRLGVAPAIISVVCLPKMPRGEAMAAFLRGNRFSAKRAVELGLIAGSVARDELDNEIDAVLADLLAGGPTGLDAAKQLVNRVPGMSRDEAFRWTSKLSADLFNGAEAAEGMAAFLEKRPAAWTPEGADQS